jgi:hypothetical protein
VFALTEDVDLGENTAKNRFMEKIYIYRNE